jgi:diguanylate cyclase (GGDEF)-like protein/putative nucleotidyltransferase with HDIG domain
MFGGDKNDRKYLEQKLIETQRRLAQLERELETRSARDPLTGLPDIRAFHNRLASEVDRSRRHGHPLSVAVLDIDGFRKLNMTSGHAVGDALLHAASRVISQMTRAHDMAARAQGDEFVVLMPDTAADGAKQCIERILLELESTATGPVSCVSASAGIATWHRGQSAEELLQIARHGVNVARADGGGRVAITGPHLDDPGVEGDSRRDAIVGLATTLLERDRYTGDHSEEVVRLTVRVARALALNDDEVERVETAALLHDIGKVGVPDSILHKDGPLDDDEWVIMKEHTVIGERILRAIPGLGGVARIVRHEHERWDGKGYPDGISGTTIPMGSRIILACDAYHAMTSDRPYRQAMSHADALRELRKNAGTQFDPQVIEALVGCLYGDATLSAPSKTTAG